MKEEQWPAHQQDHIRTWLYAVPISNSNKDNNKNWCQKLTLVYYKTFLTKRLITSK